MSFLVSACVFDKARAFFYGEDMIRKKVADISVDNLFST